MRSIMMLTLKALRLKRTPLIKYSLIVITLIAATYVLAFGVEFIQRRSVYETLHWMNGNANLLTLNILIDFLVMMFVYCLVGSLIPSIAITSLLLLTASLIGYFKVKLVGVPFFPWDLHMSKELWSILPLIISPLMIRWIGGLLAVIIALFLLRLLIPRLSFPPISRITLGLVSIILLYLFAVKSPPIASLMNQMQVFNILWNQQQNYSNNGQTLAFMMNLQNSRMPKPAGYGEPTIKTLAEAMSNKTRAIAAAATVQSAKQPNVIFVMNEAFWDPTLMTNVSFSEDPVPTIHRLQKETTSGYLLSPQFGGGTSNVEFEVLTGDSMSFLPSGSNAYQQYIHKPLPSLASYFTNQGYKSMAIHSYVSYFYNRENVYKYMGFESFKSSEYFQNPEYKGGYISDDELSRSVIHAVDTTEKPLFTYAITMQNHGPYDDAARYSEKPIKVKGDFTPATQTIIDNYTQGAHDADKALQLLIDHFKQSEEPTVIIFYGDHLPSLGYDYEVYTQSGFVHSAKPEDWTLEEIKKMHSVPFVMWSNYDLPKEHIPVLSYSFLGSYVLDKLHMEKPATFAYNYDLSRKVPGLLSNLVVDADQKLYPTVPESLKPSVNQYGELEYDELFGKKYLANFIDHDFLMMAPNPNYNLEFKKGS
jgi:phosphoglycerol transferase MdoB-like AlkP superfamily enzyme